MKVLAIYGSPRKEGNTAKMLDAALSEFPKEAEIRRAYLGELNFSGCGPCRECKTKGFCVIEDDMQKIFEDMIWAEIIIFGSPSHFSDVSVDIKKLMERTWWMKGSLRNKIGGYVVTGRRYMESTLNTLHAFMLRHRMILGGSGALGFTFSEMGGLEYDPLAIRDAHYTGIRLIELYELIYER
ncbi:MAG: flavodoxin family protein [Bacteroidetes bacterium]|nr:MAG: flavodoxin family protein [Bacteroidota bacterium]